MENSNTVNISDEYSPELSFESMVSLSDVSEGSTVSQSLEIKTSTNSLSDRNSQTTHSSASISEPDSTSLSIDKADVISGAVSSNEISVDSINLVNVSEVHPEQRAVNIVDDDEEDGIPSQSENSRASKVCLSVEGDTYESSKEFSDNEKDHATPIAKITINAQIIQKKVERIEDAHISSDEASHAHIKGKRKDYTFDTELADPKLSYQSKRRPVSADPLISSDTPPPNSAVKKILVVKPLVSKDPMSKFSSLPMSSLVDENERVAPCKSCQPLDTSKTCGTVNKSSAGYESLELVLEKNASNETNERPTQSAVKYIVSDDEDDDSVEDQLIPALKNISISSGKVHRRTFNPSDESCIRQKSNSKPTLSAAQNSYPMKPAHLEQPNYPHKRPPAIRAQTVTIEKHVPLPPPPKLSIPLVHRVMPPILTIPRESAYFYKASRATTHERVVNQGRSVLQQQNRVQSRFP